MSDQHSCVVCQRRIPNRPLVCDGDRQGLDSMLREIPDLFARLDPSPGAGGGPKVSGSREAPVPVSVDVVDLTSPARPGSVAVRMAGDWSLQGGDPLQVGPRAQLHGLHRPAQPDLEVVVIQLHADVRAS